MTFNSILFIFIFLPSLLCLYVIIPSKGKNVLLILASLLFYAWGDPKNVLLLCMIIWLNYWYARYIDKQVEKRKRAIVEAVIVNLVILLYFKYYGFLLDSIFAFSPDVLPYEVLGMPLGISFFTFSNLSYLFDVYRKKIEAEKRFVKFALFVSFFPKLIMGPIERYDVMKKQIEHHPIKICLLEKGFQTFLIGLAQKVLIADTLSTIWTQSSTTIGSVAFAWLGAIAYMLQIYFDFNGYTKMAMGLSNMFGFTIMDNFHYPYMAVSITDFWKRWHISLTSWFRDYVYIPLGGNRTTFDRYLRNFMIVWLLTGIWHGASWNFILWGVYYGVVLVYEKYILVEQITPLPQYIRRILTLLTILCGWVIFASADVIEAFLYLGRMLGINSTGFSDVMFWQVLQNYWFYIVVGILWCTPLFLTIHKWILEKLGSWDWIYVSATTICMWLLIISFLVSDTYQSFLYFKF